MAKLGAKELVAKSYNDIALDYNGWAVSKPSPRNTYLTELFSRIPSTSNVLELGCGGGIPVTKLLLEHLSSKSIDQDTQILQGAVVANDISEQQISLAKTNAPGAEYVCGDMTTLTFPESHFDGVVSFFSIFHLPRDEQPDMFRSIAKWLKPGGWCVGSLGTMDEAQIQGDFFGKEMFWSSFDVQKNRIMIEEAGMKIIQEEVLNATDPDNTEDPDHGVRFWWFLAQK